MCCSMMSSMMGFLLLLSLVSLLPASAQDVQKERLLRRGRNLIDFEDYQKDYGTVGRIDVGDYEQEGGVQGKIDVGDEYQQGGGVQGKADDDCQWKQIGMDIEAGANAAADTGFGSAISLDTSGKTARVAIGAPFHGDGIEGTAFPLFDGRGLVRVYELAGNVTDSTWVQVGGDIIGDSAGIKLGYSLSLAGNGILAVGAPDATDPDAAADEFKHGSVQVYELINGTDWLPVGSAIYGSGANSKFGTTVSMSSNAQALAVGAPLNSETLENAGRVDTFVLNGKEWEKRGPGFLGGSQGDELGSSVSLSSDGDTLAIAASRTLVAATAVTELFRFEAEQDDWTFVRGYTGGKSSAVLSGDGLVVASGDSREEGKDGAENAGKVISYVVLDDGIEEFGETLEGDYAHAGLGSSLSLSQTGAVMAVGAQLPTRSNVSDYVRIFAYGEDDDSWISVGGRIEEQTETDSFGAAVSLSSDGSMVAIGAPTSNAVRVYAIDPVCLDADGYSTMMPADEPTREPSREPSIESTIPDPPPSAPTETMSPTIMMEPTSNSKQAPTTLPDWEAKGKHFCTKEKPCPLCWGDCDGNDGCEGDLVCFERDGGEEVPGCLNGEESKSDTDYCVLPELVATSTTDASTGTTLDDTTSTTAEGSTAESTSTVSDASSTVDGDDPTPAPIDDGVDPTPAPVADGVDPTPAPVDDGDPTPAPVDTEDTSTSVATDDPSTTLTTTTEEGEETTTEAAASTTGDEGADNGEGQGRWHFSS